MSHKYLRKNTKKYILKQSDHLSEKYSTISNNVGIIQPPKPQINNLKLYIQFCLFQHIRFKNNGNYYQSYPNTGKYICVNICYTRSVKLFSLFAEQVQLSGEPIKLKYNIILYLKIPFEMIKDGNIKIEYLFGNKLNINNSIIKIWMLPFHIINNDFDYYLYPLNIDIINIP